MEKLHHENYGAKSHEQLENKFKYYLKDLPLTPEDLQKPFLDVGAHTGEFVQYLREVLQNKQAVGVEIQPAKIMHQEEGFVAADGLNLPFKDETFDVVTAHNYFPMFVDEPLKMQTSIMELLRVAKKGGKVMGDIKTPNGVIEGEKELQVSLGKDYGERNKKSLAEEYSGANELQHFLKTLVGENYDVQVTNPSENRFVLVIQKK